MWVWDETKNLANRKKHSISFETARLVFLDPYALSVPDPYPYEVRWRTFGMIANQLVLVVHTDPKDRAGGQHIGRIISARKATKSERRAYQDDTI